MRLPLLMVVVVLACGDDDVVEDAGGDALVDVPTDVGEFTTCEGECAQTVVSADFGDATEVFDLAFYGIEPDGSLRVEIYGGAAEECPTMDSPTPERTVVIPVIAPPTDTTPQDVTATLLDFEGTLTSEPLLRASSATATPIAARPEPSDTAFVRFDLVATFESGTIGGAVYATHCESLDG